ncbi:Pkinase-domain-containing protein [Panus rudis PR-1116 ss-1]|nr:Pkinase-domain-containing protein [Panus rudis PR-1116 ss-1]
MVRKKFPNIAGFVLTDRLGGGSFATVYMATNYEEQRVAACKVVDLTEETTPEQRFSLKKEIKLHSKLKHPNVLEFYHAVNVEPGRNSPYHPACYMLLELASGGDLFDKIVPDVGVGEEIAQYYFAQMIAGMRFIHKQGIVHRDLKPENLLLDATGRLKVCDFGLCSYYLRGDGTQRKLETICGSLPYIAPELTLGKPYYAEPIDVWGCGIILFTLLVGNTPWDQPNEDSIEWIRYIKGKCFNDDPWNKFGRDVLTMLTGMLAVNPHERMTFDQIYQHVWMNRPSQIANSGMAAIAAKLTENLRQTGDYDYVAPPTGPSDFDEDGDTIMRHQGGLQSSQFTQTLLLFSQTPTGRRYTPNLTRFYASAGPGILLPLIEEALDDLGVKHNPPEFLPSKDASGEDDKGRIQMRIGGFDKRRLMFKGYVKLENFEYGNYKGTFCLMHRDQGNPISWRKLWKDIIQSPGVEPYVLKKKQQDPSTPKA